jgi:23S rRNA (pseudouridine1915-N3)-methyltransferase
LSFAKVAMRLLIAAVGKLKQGPERELFEHYLARTETSGRKLGISPATVVEVPESRGPTPAARTAAEGIAMLSRVPPTHKLICLDRRGEFIESAEFAEAIGRFRDSGAAGVAFVVGGAEGLAPETLARADRKISLGPMTLPHGLARIVLAEQIYRAMTILAGHPYHRA